MNSLKTLQSLEVQSFISGPLPARGTNMFSRLLGLNTWLQRTCSTKGVNFIDNFNIFWGHRQLFKLDGLHPNKLGARVLKDNFYFSLRHPSVVCANPLTPSPEQNMSDHRTSYQLPSHHVVEDIHIHSFTFMHLADAFIQSDLQCIQAIHVLSQCVFLGNRTHNLLRC